MHASIIARGTRMHTRECVCTCQIFNVLILSVYPRFTSSFCFTCHDFFPLDLGVTQWTTPGKYVYVVPKMTTEIMIEVWGGGGGGGQFNYVKGGNGGGGAFVQTVIQVRCGCEMQNTLLNRCLQ